MKFILICAIVGLVAFALGKGSDIRDFEEKSDDPFEDDYWSLYE